jgi:hypothetical protein
MEDIKKQIKALIKEAKEDESVKYKEEWQHKAVYTLNDFYMEADRYDDIIYDLASDEWEDLVKQQLESRGWQGLLFFLGKLEPMDDYAYLDGYGNAKSCDYDLLGMLEDALSEC